ncbi:MAG: acyl-CoA dehydrogenase family protein [Dehalococcoidia bacterium]|jgi:alkylation response protein AidB-like acyl-CoA dehydrogenase|nr:acyl-CoA dehydrogenase family protein [Dehalococcoidia bacterium]
MPTAPHDTEYYLETARELATRVAANVDRIEAGRQLPTELANEIADSGFFRLLVPRSLGGAELDHPTFRKILEIIAAADGSTAWCINQNNVFATDCVRIPEQTAKEIWGEKRAVVTNGPPTASSKAVPVGGGYKLSGHWNFSSGSDHATWIAALVPVWSQDQTAPTGRESFRVMLLPKEDATFVDQWHVNGMRGTGSFSFELEDLFIPESRSYAQTDTIREDGPIYVIPRGLLFGSGFATVALGIARASLNTIIDLAVTKTPVRSTTLVQDQPTTHRLIGEAEAIWRSARAYLQESASAVWESACKNRALTNEERIQLRLASTFAIHKAAEVVDISYGLSGSNAIFPANPINRLFQDIHVITQHAQGRLVHLETAGQFLLGLEPTGNF